MAERDTSAPPVLQIIITDANGKEWGRISAGAKQFSSGSVGFYGNGKILNPDNPAARYQCGLTFTLIGSKEKPQ